MTTNRGVIAITLSMWQLLGCPTVPNAHEALLIPDEYEAEAITFYADRVELTVFNSALPNWQSDKMVQLKPIYTCTYTPDGDKLRQDVHFDHMEVTI